MKDKIIRATAANGYIRITAANTTGLVEKARKIHGTFPTATAALGRVLTATLLIGAGLKNQETVTIKIEGDGPLGTILAVGDNICNVKGYVTNPEVYLKPQNRGKMDIGKAVGKGMIYVIKDLKLKGVYTGSSPLISGEIAEDLTHYFYTSEQISTAIGLGVLVDKDISVISAGGYLLQLTPGAPEEIAEILEKNIKEMGNVSRFIEKRNDSLNIIKYLCEPYELIIHENKPAEYKCNCSKEKIQKIIISLGETEIQDIINTQGQAEVTCHFCNERYLFNREELYDLLKEAKS